MSKINWTILCLGVISIAETVFVGRLDHAIILWVLYGFYRGARGLYIELNNEDTPEK